MTFDVVKRDSNKLLLILPGVTGCSNDRYVKDIVQAAIDKGFNCAVMNHLVPKAENS